MIFLLIKLSVRHLVGKWWTNAGIMVADWVRVSFVALLPTLGTTSFQSRLTMKKPSATRAAEPIENQDIHVPSANNLAGRVLNWPTFPTCGHILHWYFLPDDPFDGCEWIWPLLLLPEAPCPWPCPPLAALIGWGTTRPVWPDWLVAGGEDEAEELLRWP